MRVNLVGKNWERLRKEETILPVYKSKVLRGVFEKFCEYKIYLIFLRFFNVGKHCERLRKEETILPVYKSKVLRGVFEKFCKNKTYIFLRIFNVVFL